MDKGSVALIVTEKFRDEAFAVPATALEEAGYRIVVVTPSDEPVTGMRGRHVRPDVTWDEFTVDAHDAVILIGGGGPQGYWDDVGLHRIAEDAVAAGKVVGAMCIAPVILARAGVLDGRKATAFPGVRRELEAHGAIFVDAVVERDGPIVTGGGPKTENAFANGILNALKSPA